MPQDNRLKSPILKLTFRLILTQLVMSIITLLLFMFFGSFFSEENAPTGFFIACFPGVFLMCMTLYSAASGIGERDYNLVKHNHIERYDMKGLAAGLFSQIPGFILAVVLVFYKTPPESINFFDFAYRLLYMPFIGLSDLFTKDAVIWRFVPLIILPLFSFWGYYNGYRFISIWHNIVYSKKPNSKEKDKRFR